VELTTKWTKDKKGRMVSKCKLGKVMIVRINSRIHRKPFRIYIAGCSKGSYDTIPEALERIENLEV
jgi:hypothetical protein